MATALTGSLGWTALHPIQLGGPPLIGAYDRKLPATTAPMSLEGAPATPFIGHAYGNDGVTLVTMFGLLNRPTLNPTLANGGFNQILLEVAAPVTGLALGNVVRLSEQGGDGSFVYGGTVEDLPDTISPSGVSHQILVSPFSTELDDTFSQAVYTSPTDITQLVRDAVALTRHCSCDQVSVPASTGQLVAQSGQVDFRNQSVRSVIDTVRSIAGPTWFWHVDEQGRVWFQAMASAAAYTIPLAQYEARTKSTSIQDRKNKVVAVGGVPTGGSLNITATSDDATSQTAIGIRALNPPLQIPNITDQAALTSIVSNILTVLNRNWQRVNLKVLPTFGRRIHASQPGGAMVRYWEPVATPMQESATGISGYTGPFIAQSLTSDGLYQQVVAGDIPVTSQTDIQNMVNSLVARAAANSLQVTAAALNLKQTLTGTFQSGTGTISLTGQPATLWSLSQTEFAAIDPAAVTRAEMGNLLVNGVSPAHWGFRANDASGNPIMDSFGLIANKTGNVIAHGTGSGTFTSTTNTDVGSQTFNVGANPPNRAVNLLCLFFFVGKVTAGTGDGQIVFNPGAAGSATGPALQGQPTGNTTGMAYEFINGVAQGSYTMKLQVSVSVAATTYVAQALDFIVLQLGS